MSRLPPDLLAYVAVTLVVLAAIADQIAPYRGSPARCMVRYVIDGDTVALTCDGLPENARLLGFDAAEVHGDCTQERALAARATARLRDLVAAGDLAIFPKGLDKYHRRLAVMTAGGRDVAHIMIDAGLAVPYDGGPRRDWCRG